jgi:hypothetical protein
MGSPDAPAGFSHRARLWIVAVGAFALCAAYVWRGAFSSDFWEHAAVVRELAARPFEPRHPLLQVDAPHAYVSPYLLAVALAARVTHAPAITALALAGLLNLVLLVLVFRRLLVRILPNGEAAAPYALLLVIFLWGKDPWMWSGFLHIAMLGYDVAYPSTVGAAAMLLGLSLLLDALQRGGTRPYVWIALLVALCIVTHPPTALAFVAGLAALLLAKAGRGGLRPTLRVGGVIVAGVAAALAWPYFPLRDLFTAQPREFHVWSAVFYQEVLLKLWPVLLAAPVLAWRARRNLRDPLVLMAALFLGLYAAGAVTGAFGLGRTIAWFAVTLQIALAGALAALESRLPQERRWLVPAGTALVLVGLFAINRPPLPRLVKYDPPLWPEVRAVLAPVRSGEVVLADSPTSYPVPALTGARVVAWRHPVYWVPDQQARRAAQDRFFTPLSEQERREILQRYRVQWILLNRRATELRGDQEAALLALGCVVGQRQSLVLIGVSREERDPCHAGGAAPPAAIR